MENIPSATPTAVAPRSYPLAYLKLAQSILRDAEENGTRFGDRKVFLSTVEGIDLGDPDCRWMLDELRLAQLLVFARADLVQAMDPELVAASEWRLDGAEFHFLVLPDALTA